MPEGWQAGRVVMILKTTARGMVGARHKVHPFDHLPDMVPILEEMERRLGAGQDEVETPNYVDDLNATGKGPGISSEWWTRLQRP